MSDWVRYEKMMKDIEESMSPEGARMLLEMTERNKNHNFPPYIITALQRKAAEDKPDEEDECPLPEGD